MEALSEALIRIFLLGRFEVARGKRILQAAEWSRHKAAALLQRLAWERRLLKDQAIDFLWPEAPLSAGANNLYRTLHSLRQTLDTTLGPGTAEATFTFEDGVLSLREAVWVDVQALEQLRAGLPARRPAARPGYAVRAGVAARLTPSHLSNLQQALALYQGDLLPDELYVEWTLAPREGLRQLHRELVLGLAVYQQEQRDYDTALGLLTPLLVKDPADEPVHRELMRSYALAGRRHQALRQYQACMDALATELDVSPEPETAALYTQILNGELLPPPASRLPAWMPPAPIALEMERSAPLVGRTAELEILRTQMHDAWHGRGRTILLAGDTGMGKTRLAYEALRAAASAGMIVLSGAAYEQEGQMPYQPFIEAVDRYLAERRDLPGGNSLGAEGSENPITHFKPSGSTDPQQEHWALFNAALTFLTGLAAHVPVVLLVDDLHAADQTSLRLFHYLVRQTRTAPIILLATYRTDIPITLTSPFNALLNALYREGIGETLNLMPLPEDAVGKIMAHILGGEADQDLVRAVFRIIEGNPFFAQEITRTLLRSGHVEEDKGQRRLKPGAELRVPAGLKGLLRERLARFGSPVEAALTAGAVIGREFSFEVLRGATALPDSQLLDSLDIALGGHLLEEAGSGYRFCHSLIRRALYDSLSQPRRAGLHTQTAEAIEVLYAQRPQGLSPHIESLAFHYDLSDRRDHALPYLLQAGQRAVGLYAFEVAVDYFERALALMDELSLADPARRWTILEALGWWRTILADTPRAVACFEQALALPAGESWQSTRRERARVHRGAAVVLLTAGETGAAEAHLQAALAEIDERQDAADYAHVLYNMAQLHWHRNQHRAAFDMAQHSLAIAERLNDPASIARAFEMLALACHSLGEWQQGLQFEDRRSALAGPSLDVTEAFDVHL